MLNKIVSNIETISADTPHEPNRLPRAKLPPLALQAGFFKGPYPQIDFVLGLNEVLGLKIPDLGAESARNDLVEIFEKNKIALPAQRTLPRLLDKLSTSFLEPQCDKPTWIVNHPECLSPLSKSFIHPSPDVAQPVAARAELFIGGQEIVNCYEEENSPFEQRHKFAMQQTYALTGDGKTSDPEAMQEDEAYLRALEWGLPPTGGWGCGIDRLVMLLTGKQRINDVLTFGNLRSVTRTPESRKMVRLPVSPLCTLTQKTNPEIVSEITTAGDKHIGTAEKFAREGGNRTKRQINTSVNISKVTKKRRKDAANGGHTAGDRSTKTGQQIDNPEEAVVKIKKKFNIRRSGRTKQNSARLDSLTDEQKRMATE
jgi:tRNA synthetases class II (D, K and N)